jgi:molecular chaperone GrpE (heat shock protein)
MWFNGTSDMLLGERFRSWKNRRRGATNGDNATLQHDDALLATEALPALDNLGREVAQLRRTLLKLGHAQEMFQQRIEEEVGRLSRRPETGDGGPAGALPNAAQQRALIEVDQAVLHLLDLAQGAQGVDRETSAADPRSVREGLALLQIRVRNLQRSFGLEPIPTVGRLFDDRCHQAYGVCSLPDLADGEIAEEVLPGYRLRDRVVRPALVIVNRVAEPELSGD